MRITLVSSCGLVLEAEGRTLLVDALNKQFRCYYGLPPETFAQMLAGEPPYDALCGILCTHAHPDHYNALRTRQLQAASGAPVFVPQPQTPPKLALQVGPALFDFLFVFCAGFMDLFLGFDEHHALLVLAALDGFVDDASCFFLRAADLFFSDLLAVRHADDEEHNAAHHKACDAENEG